MPDDDKLTAALTEIRDREKHATPGPWGWFGNTDTHSITLATTRFGRLVVMGFARWGMSGAKPLFTTGRRWKPNPDSMYDFPSFGVLDGPDKLPVFEVAPAVTDRKHPDVYRADITGIRAPDAEFIAHSRDDVTRLLAAVDAALMGHDPVQVYANADVCGHERPREPDDEDHVSFPQEAASMQWLADTWEEDHPSGAPLTPDGENPGRVCLAKPQEIVCPACSENRYGESWEMEGAYVLASDCTVRPKITAALAGGEKSRD